MKPISDKIEQWETMFTILEVLLNNIEENIAMDILVTEKTDVENH